MDRRLLSPVQLAAITRIYGDHGAEILELLRKNPCKTIPVILRRLRQKDLEWRVVSEQAVDPPPPMAPVLASLVISSPLRIRTTACVSRFQRTCAAFV